MSNETRVATFSQKSPRANRNVRAGQGKFPIREVDEATVSRVIDLVLELNRDTLRELANY